MSVELLKKNQDILIGNFLHGLKSIYPEKIINYDRHVTELNTLFECVYNDLKDQTTINLQHLAALLYDKGKFDADVVYSSEMVNTQFFQMLTVEAPDLGDDLFNLSEIFKTACKGAPFTKKRFMLDDKEKFLSDLNNLAEHRYNYKPLEGSVKEDDLKIILDAANGVTPALSNEYNYRVDVVPDHLKKDIYEKTKNFSVAARDTGNAGYAIDNNPQLLAPVVLVFSLRYNLDNENIEQFCGDMTVRDPNIMNVGMCVWHTTLVAEALGYKTSFAQMTAWKRDKCKEILGLTSSDPQSEITIKRSGTYDFMPMVFLCIGDEGTINSNTRKRKRENLVNVLDKN